MAIVSSLFGAMHSCVETVANHSSYFECCHSVSFITFPAVMKKRLTHVRAVKKRCSVYCNADKYRKIVQESNLYDYLVVVTLEFNKETRRYQPVEKSRYPQEVRIQWMDQLKDFLESLNH